MHTKNEFLHLAVDLQKGKLGKVKGSTFIFYYQLNYKVDGLSLPYIDKLNIYTSVV